MRQRVLILGGSFAGLAAARYIRKYCGERVDVSLIDTKPYLMFVPNIVFEVLAGNDPDETLLMPTAGILEREHIDFIQAVVEEIDLDNARVRYTPSERPGAPSEYAGYDFLVIALGARLAFDRLPGFNRHGHSITDAYHGNRLRKYLTDGYRGGPIAIGSARFTGGGAYAQMPEVMAACEYPVIEAAFSLGAWLVERGIACASDITLFTPGTALAPEAGGHIPERLAGIAASAGYRLVTGTGGISRIEKWGVGLGNGMELEAELKVVLPDWESHKLLKGLPVADGAGFVDTDDTMRCQSYRNVFAVGDCASLTVPKLGEMGDAQAKVAAACIAQETGAGEHVKDVAGFKPEIIFIGGMGKDRAFFIHSDVCYGGNTCVFKAGYSYYSMKLGFKEVYFRTGGRPPSWGVPLAELVAERLS